MNILIVTQYFWPESFRINDLARLLVKKGNKVTVLTSIPNYPEGSFYPEYGFFKKRKQDYYGVRIIRVPIIPRGQSSRIRLVLNYLSFVLSASFLGPLLCRSKFDLIFVYEPSPVTVGLPAIVLKKVKKAPIMFWVQDLWPETLSAVNVVKSSCILKIVKKLVAFIYSHCDRILVQSQAFRPSISKFGITDNRILYYPNSAEEFYQSVSLNAEDQECNVMPLGFRIVFAGNIGAAQDFPTILNAAKRLKEFRDIHWVIIGDGRMRVWVEKQIEKFGLSENVHLLGKHPVETMPRFFSCADVLLASLKKEPIFALTIPAKIQSYLACGKPIVACMDGEGARIVNDAEAGISCLPENPDALAAAVLELHRTPLAKREQMGSSGREYFETHFESKMLVNRLENWMNDLIHVN